MKKTIMIISFSFLLAGCSEMDSLMKKVSFLKDKFNSQSESENRYGENGQSNEGSSPRNPDGNKPVLEAVYFNQVAEANGKKVILNPENMLSLVNKEFFLSSDYKPKDLMKPDIPFSFGDQDVEKSLIREEAGLALEEMFMKAAEQNIEIFAVSGYRSYTRQKALFDAEVKKSGSAKATQLVALPGQSEHQTGLTMDITSRSTNLNLTEEFGETVEGKWLAENAHKFGFILRYPKGKESITGYQYEPWHFRYVGREAAKTIYENDWTLEEFFNEVEKI
ncbi:D-alanyl-D-alanine carboxypeptidase family protein [Neobacillus notoginsengisoli]|uniref:D-alanyl-D-alanine carboxypeptidase family protein n=1 Tax=Neobacillus notoginsengisoli TaxID=1578198 RepID=A0A417YY14_9BACI|nr:M15 family metallopeptidase [Neobacillus notoginsengisoli]RHW42252.1 D-alanyl-D-alanine carboxypeptidase family protein [Neobacillus notoginsengisoli]